MVAILVAVVISIVVINIVRKKKKKPVPHLLCSILSSRVLEIGMCLPKVKVC